MSKQRLNGRSHGSAATHTGAKDRGNGRDTDSHQPRPNQGYAEMAGSSHLPAPRQPQLTATMRQIRALIKQNVALREEKALLSEALAKANRFAYRDELTGLPNRRLLQDHLDQAVARAKRQHDQLVLLFLDLNGFKRINDAIGHLAADCVLQQLAGRLTSCIRRCDTACRFGGDEFVVLLTDIAGKAQAMTVTNRIISQLTIPYAINGASVRVPASVGMATYPEDGTQYDELLQAADLSMYRDKACAVAGRKASPGAGAFRYAGIRLKAVPLLWKRAAWSRLLAGSGR